MQKSGYVFWALLALWLAGCATAPKKSTLSPTDWETGETRFAPIPIPPSPPKPGPAPVWPGDIAGSWITLDHWCEMNRLTPPTRFATLGRSSYSVVTPNGTLALRAGSRAAVWTGMELQLGFAPREAEGRLLVHVLDALKNFQPLLPGSPLPAAGSRLIVLDPGHGGGNTGTRSVLSGRFEKEFTLDWALRLGPLLQANGWRVRLTRTNDVEVPLGERVAFAEQCRADFFLSLHFNATPQGQEQAGAETYCVTPKGMPSNLTREFEDDASKYFPNNAFDAQNLQYALRLHRALLSVNGHNDRGVRRARFMGVLLGQQRPAVLLEAGYLSSPAEAARIADPAFRQKLAEAVAAALQ